MKSTIDENAETKDFVLPGRNAGEGRTESSAYAQKKTIFHGGDRESFFSATGREPLDFSVNLNPLGIPVSVVSAYTNAAAKVRYPDPLCRELTAALAGHYFLPAENILCGNGASDLIYRYFYAVRPGRVFIPVPTFSEYPRAVSVCGGQCVFYPLKEEDAFSLTSDITDFLRGIMTLRTGLFSESAAEQKAAAEQKTAAEGRAETTGDCRAGDLCDSSKPDVLVLIHPNNPTGRLIDRDVLRKILVFSREQGVRVFMDACFLELTGVEFPFAHVLEEYPNVFILNAFTKTYAMAGMRLGYGMTADTGLLSRMRTVGPPWSVSFPAQKAGLAALQESTDLKRAVAEISAERARIMKALTSLGYAVIPSDANYIMFASGQELANPLAAAGIMIRDLNGEIGLQNSGKYWYRIAVRTPEENNIILEELRKITGQV